MQFKRHSTLFLCLIVAMIVSTALSTTVVRRCVEGKRYFDGCNDCHCAQGRVLCTRKICTVWDPVLNETVAIPTIKPPADFWEQIPELKVPVA